VTYRIRIVREDHGCYLFTVYCLRSWTALGFPQEFCYL